MPGGRHCNRKTEFASVWDRQEVGLHWGEAKRIVHPQVGRIDLFCQNLQNPDQSQSLLIFTATPGTDSYDKLALLNVLGADSFPVGGQPRFLRRGFSAVQEHSPPTARGGAMRSDARGNGETRTRELLLLQQILPPMVDTVERAESVGGSPDIAPTLPSRSTTDTGS
ncbi:hypothetical protein ACIHCQ_32485 [Streptomyces sp. NPDC052236]|uniref:MmyB family transcriptional regulator n=1 Tax=Streptomyces sp. NPDC052236 TaxID=3365686 RepID=UPI0037CEAC45